MSKLIRLTKGAQAIVDDEDYRYLSRWKWHVSTTGYAIRDKTVTEGSGKIYMHRIVNNTPLSRETDHINGNILDNRRANLREATHIENSQNRQKHRDNSSGLKGVWQIRGGKWRATICHNYQKKHLGLFNTKDEAYDAYCKASRELNGRFARV